MDYLDPSNVILPDGYSTCVDALRAGQVDAVTSDNVVLFGFVGASQGSFKLVGKPFGEDPQGIGIARGDVAFCELINKALRDAESDRRYGRAWTSTAGAVDPAVPSLTAAQACS